MEWSHGSSRPALHKVQQTPYENLANSVCFTCVFNLLSFSQRSPNPPRFALRLRRPTKKKSNTHTKCVPLAHLCRLQQEQTHPNLHPIVGDTPGEDLLAAEGANSGGFGAHCFSTSSRAPDAFQGTCSENEYATYRAGA